MKHILVIGGGQLGWMLALEAEACELEVDRFDFSSSELIVAAGLGESAQRRKITNSNELLERYDVITAELEHLPLSPIVADLVNSDKWINRHAFDVLPDRYSQKKLLDKLAITTSPWRLIDNAEALTEAQSQLGDLVIKTTRGGYDGRGQWRTYTPQRDRASDIIPDAVFGQIIGEACIAFNSEVSLIGARNANGDCYFYPLTINRHDKGILRYSLFLSEHRSLKVLQREAQEALAQIMTHLNYAGVMAMECFLTNGVLMVNELAPRVHNSGHWTQQGTDQSQFELHLRGIANLPFSCEHTCRSTLMLNLIGCDFHSGWQQLPHVTCYWYEKEVCPARKVGHLNIDIESIAQLADTVNELTPLLDPAHQDFLLQAQASCLKVIFK